MEEYTGAKVSELKKVTASQVQTKTGGGDGMDLSKAIVIEKADNGYILRTLGLEGEEMECLVYTDRSELMRDVTKKLD